MQLYRNISPKKKTSNAFKVKRKYCGLVFINLYLDRIFGDTFIYHNDAVKSIIREKIYQNTDMQQCCTLLVLTFGFALKDKNEFYCKDLHLLCFLAIFIHTHLWTREYRLSGTCATKNSPSAATLLTRFIT